MSSARFIRDEADLLVGKTFESLVEFMRVPKGTRGTVVNVHHATGSNIFVLVIDWELDKTIYTKTVREALTLYRYEIGRLAARSLAYDFEHRAGADIRRTCRIGDFTK